ncbi:MAG: glycine cleavage system protein GcvH [Gemmataceae bacterium]
MDPQNLRYAKTHEWSAVEGDQVKVGITKFAVDLLTDLTHVELPKVGRSTTAGAAVGEIESVKAVSDLYSPVDGEIVAVNQEAAGNPGLITNDPYGEGWLFKVKLKPGAKLDHLLDLKQYEAHIAEGH